MTDVTPEQTAADLRRWASAEPGIPRVVMLDAADLIESQAARVPELEGKLSKSVQKIADELQETGYERNQAMLERDAEHNRAVVAEAKLAQVSESREVAHARITELETTEHGLRGDIRSYIASLRQARDERDTARLDLGLARIALAESRNEATALRTQLADARARLNEVQQR